MFEYLAPSRRDLPLHDPIFLANAEAQRRKAEGIDVVNATLGSLVDDRGNLVVLDTIADVLRDLSPMESAPYAPITGHPEFLRALIQRHWPKHDGSGAGCSTPGGSGALSTSLRNFLEPGMSLLAAAPCWGPYRVLARENGVGFETAPFPEAGKALDGDAWSGALDKLMKAQGRVLLWLNEPCHNPTGHSLTREDRQVLISALRRAAQSGPVTLILDCAYLDYTTEPAHVREALDQYAELGEEGRVLVGGALSISKAFTLYGGRGGALVFPWCRETQLQAALANACRGTWSTAPLAPQSVMMRIARDGKLQARLAAEHRHWSEVIASRALALDGALRAEGLAGCAWRGGFFITLRLDRPAETTEALKGQNAFVVPMPEGVRIGICALQAELAPRFARALREALRN